jgi:hypothetical protein
LVLGGKNVAAFSMQYASPFIGVPLNTGWITSFVPPPQGTATTTVGSTANGGAVALTTTNTTTGIAVTTAFRTPALSTYLDLANDDHALTYFSPRWVSGRRFLCSGGDQQWRGQELSGPGG